MQARSPTVPLSQPLCLYFRFESVQAFETTIHGKRRSVEYITASQASLHHVQFSEEEFHWIQYRSDGTNSVGAFSGNVVSSSQFSICKTAS